MNILSLDFDYFQVVNEEILSMYPDGIDLPTRLSELVWASKYAHYGDKLMNVTVNGIELMKAKEIINKQNRDIPVMIASSHVSIYDFIHQIQDEKKSIQIVNVDTHHDCFNENKEVDCGNWISFILKEYPKSKLIWVANPISLEVYDAPELNPLVHQSLAYIEDMHFDAIFLCRSDNWTPPHLDTDFFDLVQELKKFQCVQVQKGLTKRTEWLMDTIEIQKTCKIEQYS